MNLRNDIRIGTPTIVLAEGAFGKTDGKTANGVVMHGELFNVQAIVDSKQIGKSPSEVLGYSKVPNIPIVKSVKEALLEVPEAEALVIGVAPSGGRLPETWVKEIEIAIEYGCDVVSGLHTFLGDDAYWSSLAENHNVRLFDVRKPPDESNLRVGDGSIDEIDANVVLVLGTDCSVGKRTTTFELYKAARESNLNAGWVATGQTGIMVGAHRGVVIDRVPADFTAGVVENLVKGVAENHSLIFVEGQAALTHRAYSGVTLSILHGAWPELVVIADDPSRKQRSSFNQFSIGGIQVEKTLIEELSNAEVAAISTWGNPDQVESKHEIPAANIFNQGGSNKLLDKVLESINSPLVSLDE